MQKSITKLQVILSIIFVSSMLISNVVTAKQLQLPFGITMTGAIFIFPLTYILSDIFSEIYGYKWSRFTCYMAFAMNLLMVAIFELVILTPAPEYWQNQQSFIVVLGSTPRVLIASLTAFVMGDLVNDKIFKKLKSKHHDLKGFEFRAILSSFIGECVDSLIFIPLAFIGTMPIKTLIIMGITQVCLKVGYEIIILPITKISCKTILKYEQKVK